MTEPTKVDLIQQFHRLGRDYSTATVLFHQAIASRVGLTATDIRCLDVISRNHALPAGAIAEQTGLTSGAVTTLIDRLEKRGFARRVTDPSDRRRVLVEPCPEAQRTLRPLYEPLAAAINESFEQISINELQAILEFLKRGITVLDTQRDKLGQMPHIIK